MGSGGFIGSHLMHALKKEGCRVTAFKRKGVHNVPAVSELKSFVNGVDIIYHLGGVNRGTPSQILRGNILAMQNLIESVQSLAADRPHIVFLSSSQVYRLQENANPILESDDVIPQSIYGIAKKTAEELLILSGIKHTILRCSNVYGPACKPYYNSVIATFCNQALNGETLTLNGDGSHGRDFLYIDDAIKALLAVAVSPLKETRGMYNVSSGKITALNKIAKLIASLVPGAAYEHNRHAETGDPSYCCDSRRFRRCFKWKPDTSIGQGISLTLQWHKKNLAL